jgi:fatty-acyl-CoA synthase
MNIYDQQLDRNAANFAALSPVSFVERSAEVFGDLPAVIHGARRASWRELRDRSARLAAVLRAFGVGRGSTVTVMLPNTPEMVEAHYAVPALNAVLNTLNTRLDAPLLAWQMNHCEAAVVITDREFAPAMGEALRLLREQHGRTPVVIDVCDSEYTGPGERLGSHEYEALLAAHAPLDRLEGPADEWDAIAVSYTSGTTGDPKGVVTHHRGAYLNAVCNAATWTMPHFPKYLWTLPMFHCNGWCFPWTVAMLGGVHVCLRRVEAPAILGAMREHGVDHYCAAPIVHNLIIAAPDDLRAGIRQKVRGMVAGAAPPAAMIEGMARLGFDITHVYGLTEVYGPAAVAVKRAAWAGQDLSEQTRLNGRQGVRYMLQEGMTVLDAETMAETPADGQTMGEIMFRGNIVMKGYRGCALPAPRGDGLRGRRAAAPEVGRDAARVRRAQAGRGDDGRGTRRPLQGTARRLQGAPRDPLRGDPQDLDRQDPEVPAARTCAQRQCDRVREATCPDPTSRLCDARRTPAASSR